MMNSIQMAARLTLAAVIAAAAATTAAAHPHVWVDVKSKVIYDSGRVTGFKNAWTFDEGYSTMAIEGLDKNGDGKYDREELAELAQVNIDGLKEFDYFTHPKLGTSALKIAAPKDYWLTHEKGILTLHFTLPLADPVLATAPDFSFQVYDPSFYIAFELNKAKPVTLAAGAPTGCKVDVSVAEDETAEAEKLGEAFYQQFGGDIGIGLAQTVSITCPAS
ncbi:MAG: DUF1007 family protein [Alphaproteobacteria bacterium]|nr:DUF1007 family protein [Alphaproteobacteria bacterium]